MKKRYSLEDIPTLKNRALFLDANVLLYIFWPTGSVFFENIYSKIFSKLLQQKNQMYIDFTVISEVINRVIRIEYEKHISEFALSKKEFVFKSFRDSSFGHSALNDIYQIIQKKVLSHFDIIEKGYSLDEISSFLNQDNLDFNDKAIEYLCMENKFIFITNDSDFKDSDMEILTSNNKLINN